VAVVTLPPVIADIAVSALLGHAQLDIIARFESRAGILPALQILAPELILFGLRPAEPTAPARLLRALVAPVAIIAFAPDGRDASLHEMRPTRRTYKNVSPRDLVRIITRAGAPPRV
jgi:hypothetical protein